MSLTDPNFKAALHRESCDPKERLQSGGVVAVFFKEERQSAAEIVEVFGDPVGQVSVLRLSPHELDGIELGRIRGQTAGPEPRAARSPQLGCGGPMRGQAVPDQEHGSPQVRLNKPKKSHEINRVAVMVQQVVIQAEALLPWSHRQSANHAQAIMSVPGISHGSFPRGSPNPAPQWLQKEATFIEKNNASFSFGSLFLAGALDPAPSLDGVLISFASSIFRLLRAPAELMQKRADVIDVKIHRE